MTTTQVELKLQCPLWTSTLFYMLNFEFFSFRQGEVSLLTFVKGCCFSSLNKIEVSSL